MFVLTSAGVHGRRAQRSRGPWSTQRERERGSEMTNQFGCSADQSAARREERCVAPRRGAEGGWGWEGEGGREG